MFAEFRRSFLSSRVNPESRESRGLIDDTPTPILDASLQPRLSLGLLPTYCGSELPMTISLISITLMRSSQTSRKHLFAFTNLSKNMNTDEVILTVRSGRVWVQEHLSLWSWEVSLSWCGRVCPSGTSPNPTLWKFCGIFSYNHDQLSTHCQPPFPLWRIGWWSWKFQASIHGLIFLVTNQQPSKSHLIKTKEVPITLIT